MKEQVFYSSRGILVTDLKVVIDNKIFTVKNISSVEMCEHIIRPKKGGALAMLIIGGILTIFFLKQLFGIDYNVFEFHINRSNFSIFLFEFVLLPGILLTTGGILLLLLPKPKTIYSVRLYSQTGKNDTIVSKDKEYVQKIVDAIHLSIQVNQKSFEQNERVEKTAFPVKTVAEEMNIIEKLKELAKLKTDSVISEDEFVALKQKIVLSH